MKKDTQPPRNETPVSLLGILVGFSGDIKDPEWPELHEGIRLARNLTFKVIENDLSQLGSFAPEFHRGYHYACVEVDGIPVYKVHEDFNPLKKVLLAFRLFQAGDIFLEYLYQTSARISQNDTRFTLRYNPSPDPVIYNQYNLNSGNFPLFFDLYNEIKKVRFDKASINVACGRFNRYFEDHRPDDRLIDMCISFESLFFKGKNIRGGFTKGEIIGLACSMLIGKNSKDRNIQGKYRQLEITVRLTKLSSMD